MPVYIRYSGWSVYFWTNENDEPIHFHIAEQEDIFITYSAVNGMAAEWRPI